MRSSPTDHHLNHDVSENVVGIDVVIAQRTVHSASALLQTYQVVRVDNERIETSYYVSHVSEVCSEMMPTNVCTTIEAAVTP